MGIQSSDAPVCYYSMAYPSIVEDYIVLEDAQLEGLSEACIESAFQLLDRKTAMLQVSAQCGGLTYPDFYYRMGVPLFSERAYTQLHDLLRDCFQKSVLLCDPLTQVQHPYRLVLPDQIDGLCIERSIIAANYGSVEKPLYRVKKTVLQAGCEGCYQIFKLKHVLDTRLYVTETFRRRVDALSLEGISFYEIQAAP